MKRKRGVVLGKLICMSLCAVLLAGCSKVDSTILEETGQQAVEEGVLVEASPTKMPAPPETSEANVDMPENQTIINDTIYDEVLNPIGTVLSRQVVGYSESNPELELYHVTITWPEIDVSFDGADTINEAMLKYVDSNIAYMEQYAGMPEEEYIINPSFSSSFDGFTYRDDHYISFIQSEYDYQGGVHGMPYWEPFTFHLQTGEQLQLTDIIGNSEEELKEIVTGYFAKMINVAPEEYWEDAEAIVEENISLESNFVLTQKGIKFYMLPYDIAPYAAGFPEVNIPYEEFDMKIELEVLE